MNGIEIAKCNADVALDQSAGRADAANVIQDYRENMGLTLAEHGFADGSEDVYRAYETFDAIVAGRPAPIYTLS